MKLVTEWLQKNRKWKKSNLNRSLHELFPDQMKTRMVYSRRNLQEYVLSSKQPFPSHGYRSPIRCR